MPVELPTIGMHCIPPTSEVGEGVPPADGRKVDFHYFMYPFIALIGGGRRFLFSANREIWDYCQRMVEATRTVFYQLIYPPSFDPTHASFKETLDRFEAKIPRLRKRIDQLEQRFWQNHLITRDVQELEKLNKEVVESLGKLDHYAHVLEGGKFRFPVQDQLDRVRDAFHALDDQIDVYCMAQGKSIFEKFQKVMDVFTGGNVGLQKDIHQTMIQMWKGLYAVFYARVRNQLHTPKGRDIRFLMSEIRSQMKVLEKQSSEEVHAIHFAHPLKLRNIGNSCYLDSVLQALLCIGEIRHAISEPLERDMSKPLEDYQKKLAIQQEILQFIEAQPKHQGEQRAMTQMEYILYLLEGPSLRRLRDAIFKSGLGSAEFHMASLTRQLDAASVAELLTDEFLSNCKFEYQALRTAPALAGLQFKGLEEQFSVLQIPLRVPDKYHKLDKLVNTSLGPHIEHNKRKFDTKEGEIITGKEDEAALIFEEGETEVDLYHERYRFVKKMPSVLVVQFKRFINEPSTSDPSKYIMKKVELPVILPDDGILDLSQYYDAPEGESKDARYRIKSMVRHRGGLHGGHYLAEVEINGKYYHCDDTDPKAYKEVSETEFYGHKDPYLLVLERITDDKVEAAKPVPEGEEVKLVKSVPKDKVEALEKK